MKRVFKISIILALLTSLVVMESCNTRARDCRGRKKTAKTNMGGWL